MSFVRFLRNDSSTTPQHSPNTLYNSPTTFQREQLFQQPSNNPSTTPQKQCLSTGRPATIETVLVCCAVLVVCVETVLVCYTSIPLSFSLAKMKRPVIQKIPLLLLFLLQHGMFRAFQPGATRGLAGRRSDGASRPPAVNPAANPAYGGSSAQRPPATNPNYNPQAAALAAARQIAAYPPLSPAKIEMRKR